MTQVTSSGWAGAVSAPLRQLNYSLSIAFSLATASGINYFTVGTSTIGGPDIIKSGGGTVAFFDQYAYTDYSKYVMSLNVNRSIGQFPFGAYIAQADIELDNSSLLFLPGHDATIGSGILPNRPFKIGIGLFGEYMNQFVGFAGQPDQDIVNRVATFHAFDAMSSINGFMSTASGSKVNMYSTDIMASLLGEMGFGVGQYVMDSSLQTPIGYAATYGLMAGDIIQSLCEAEQGLGFIDENGIFRFWNRQHFTTTSGIAAFALTYKHVADIQYENTGIINDVTVTANPRAVQANQKVWELTGTITLLPGQSTLYIVDFSDDDGAMPVTNVDTPVPTLGSATSYYGANTALDGSGSDVSSSVYIQSAYSYGNQYWITFYNPTASTYYVTQMGLWATAAKVTVHIVQQYYDQASITAYGRNPANNGATLPIANDFIQDSSAANSLARTLVYEYKDPKKRFTVPVANGSNPALQIGDYGTLTIEDTGEVKQVWIVGRGEQIDRSGSYTQTLELEERSIQNYFTIGSSTIGGNDSIAP